MLDFFIIASGVPDAGGTPHLWGLFSAGLSNSCEEISSCRKRNLKTTSIIEKLK